MKNVDSAVNERERLWRGAALARVRESRKFAMPRAPLRGLLNRRLPGLTQRSIVLIRRVESKATGVG